MPASGAWGFAYEQHTLLQGSARTHIRHALGQATLARSQSLASLNGRERETTIPGGVQQRLSRTALQVQHTLPPGRVGLGAARADGRRQTKTQRVTGMPHSCTPPSHIQSRPAPLTLQWRLALSRACLKSAPHCPDGRMSRLLLQPSGTSLAPHTTKNLHFTWVGTVHSYQFPPSWAARRTLSHPGGSRGGAPPWCRLGRGRRWCFRSRCAAG